MVKNYSKLSEKNKNKLREKARERKKKTKELKRKNESKKNKRLKKLHEDTESKRKAKKQEKQEKEKEKKKDIYSFKTLLNVDKKIEKIKQNTKNVNSNDLLQEQILRKEKNDEEKRKKEKKEENNIVKMVLDKAVEIINDNYEITKDETLTKEKLFNLITKKETEDTTKLEKNWKINKINKIQNLKVVKNYEKKKDIQNANDEIKKNINNIMINNAFIIAPSVTPSISGESESVASISEEEQMFKINKKEKEKIVMSYLKKINDALKERNFLDNNMKLDTEIYEILKDKKEKINHKYIKKWLNIMNVVYKKNKKQLNKVKNLKKKLSELSEINDESSDESNKIENMSKDFRHEKILMRCGGQRISDEVDEQLAILNFKNVLNNL